MSEERLSEALARWDSFVEPLADYEQPVVDVARRVLEPIPESLWAVQGFPTFTKKKTLEQYRQYLLNGENNGVQ